QPGAGEQGQRGRDDHDTGEEELAPVWAQVADEPPQHAAGLFHGDLVLLLEARPEATPRHPAHATPAPHRCLPSPPTSAASSSSSPAARPAWRAISAARRARPAASCCMSTSTYSGTVSS